MQKSLPITGYEREFRLAEGATIEVDLFAVPLIWTGFVVPASQDLSEFSYAHKYGSENPKAPFPGGDWWIDEREISQWVSGRTDDDLLCLLRTTGSDFESQYAVIEFDWDEFSDARNEWEKDRTERSIENERTNLVPPAEDDPPLLNADIKIVYDPRDFISQPLELDALENSLDGIPMSTSNKFDYFEFGPSSIEMVDEIVDDLPCEEILPSTAAALSAYLGNFNELEFTFDEYLSALVTRRVRDRDEMSYYSIFEVVEQLESDEIGLSSNFDTGDSGFLNPDIPTLDQLVEEKQEIPDIKITSAALDDLRQWYAKERTVHLNDMKLLVDKMPPEEIFPLPSESVNRTLYRFSTEGGIVFWVNPEHATALVSNSVSEIIVEASIEADVWYNTANTLRRSSGASICSEFCRLRVNTDVFPREPIKKAIKELDQPKPLQKIPGIGNKLATQLANHGIKSGVELSFAYADGDKRSSIEEILEDLPKNHENKVRNYANRPWQHIYKNFS